MHDNSAAGGEEEAAVRSAYERLMDGWNQGSGPAYAAAFTEDGDLVGAGVAGPAPLLALAERPDFVAVAPVVAILDLDLTSLP